jgi:hypothetical protein
VGGLVGDPRMEDHTTIVRMAHNGTTATRECGEFQRDEIRPFELAHSCRLYLILARVSDFRDFPFVQLVAVTGFINSRDKTWTELISSLLWNTERLRKKLIVLSGHMGNKTWYGYPSGKTPYGRYFD